MRKKLCIRCKKRPIFLKKDSLCKICYYREYNKNYRKRINRIENIPRLQLTLRSKYGENILTDFEELNYRASGSLTEISKIYGFSKERARQIYKAFNGCGFTKIRKAKTAKIKDIIRETKHKLSYRESHYKGNCATAVKAEAIIYGFSQKVSR